ncbi:hypothetical protein [Microvirga sesbaniae]|uniref:hypothetical protein n=1 Tax=Microvirga sesbaniae TaxID=681392 RepID=UPI0021C6B7E7|nr:hypothetical protein [Microvirga sp. HBU67692]
MTTAGLSSSSNFEESIRELVKLKHSQQASNAFEIGSRLSENIARTVIFSERKGAAVGYPTETKIADGWRSDALLIADTLKTLTSEQFDFDERASSVLRIQEAACRLKENLDRFLNSAEWRCAELLDRYRAIAAALPINTNPPNLIAKPDPPRKSSPVDGIRIVYFQKAADLGLVEKVFDDHGIVPSIQNGTNDKATNVLTCSPAMRLGAVKWLATTLMAAGVRLQGIAPQGRRTSFIGVEHYPEFSRMPFLTASDVDKFRGCKVWNDETVPAPYITLTYNCSQPFEGTIKFANPFTKRWETQRVEFMPGRKWFLKDDTGGYPTSAFSYVQLNPDWDSRWWRVQIGTEIGCL